MTRKPKTDPTDQVLHALMRELGFEDVTERGVDRLDFHEVHVACAERVIRKALALGAERARSPGSGYMRRKGGAS